MFFLYSCKILRFAKTVLQHRCSPYSVAFLFRRSLKWKPLGILFNYFRYICSPLGTVWETLLYILLLFLWVFKHSKNYNKDCPRGSRRNVFANEITQIQLRCSLKTFNITKNDFVSIFFSKWTTISNFNDRMVQYFIKAIHCCVRIS